MGILKGLRALKAAALGNMTATEMQAYLAVADNRAGFQKAIRLPSQFAMISASAAAGSSLTGSGLAMTDICAATDTGSGGLLAALLSSAVTQSAVLNTATSFNAILSSSKGTATLGLNATVLGIVVNSASLMAAVAAIPEAFVNEAACATAACANNTAVSALFNSSTARAAIAVSTVFIATLSVSTPAKAWVVANKQLSRNTDNDDGVVGTFVPFGAGFPSRILIITTAMFQNNPGGTMTYKSVLARGAGTGGTGDLMIMGTPPPGGPATLWSTFNAPAFDLTIGGAGGYAQVIKYVDMT